MTFSFIHRWSNEVALLTILSIIFISNERKMEPYEAIRRNCDY